MMTSLLEKLILNNKAVFSVHNHSYSSYGQIPIGKGKLVILTGFVWHHFFNPFLSDALNTTIGACKDFSLEWQMKIESAKSKNYFVFKNGWWFANTDTATNDTLLTDFLAANANPIYFRNPEKRELYMVCEEFISITITRNTCTGISSQSVVGVVNAKANEQVPPNGIDSVNLQLKTRFGNAAGAFTQQQYIPAGTSAAGVTGTDRTAQSYMQDVIATESIIQPNYSTLYNEMPSTMTQPLVEFHLVTVNSNEYSDMINQ